MRGSDLIVPEVCKLLKLTALFRHVVQSIGGDPASKQNALDEGMDGIGALAEACEVSIGHGGAVIDLNMSHIPYISFT